MTTALSHLSDADLLSELRDSLVEERERLVIQLKHLAELERRKLFLHYQSLWHYLTRELGVEESSAYRRVQAARLLVKFPEIESGVESGQMNLSLLSMADEFFRGGRLSREEERGVLESLKGKSGRAAQRELSRLRPGQEPLPRDQVRVLNDEYSELRFAVKGEVLEDLEKVLGLLAHSHPGIGLGELLGILAKEYLKRHHPEERTRRADERRAQREAARSSKQPTELIKTVPTSEVEREMGADGKVETESEAWAVTPGRRPSQRLIRALIRKEGYRCTYRDPVTKLSCGSSYGLEIDHKKAWGLGGKTELENLRFYCRNHNLRAAIMSFGIEKVRR